MEADVITTEISKLPATATYDFNWS